VAVSALLRGAALTGLLLIAAAAPAAAQAPAGPDVRFAAGSPAMVAAQQIAREHWGVDPCGGAIDIVWVSQPESYNAISSWANAGDPYADWQGNVDCRIEFNRDMGFGWAKFCTVLVHEYGHLAGQRHDEHPGELMSAIYDRPIAECVPPKPAFTAPSRRSTTSPARRTAR
jgi:hypothetical protein